MPQPSPAPRIALIDDDTTFLELMRDLLEVSEGYQVVMRKAWEQAYEWVKAERPDLVVLDIVMEREERGWRILELLTLDPETRPIPVVVCSAAIRSLHAHQEQLDRYGVLALPKPFDLQALLDAVRHGLQQGSR